MTATQPSAGTGDDGVRATIAFGIATLVVLFGAISVWALLAPLDSAVVAAGTVAVEHSRKTVKHPSGGIVTALLVAEGDTVAAGDVLLRIDNTDAQATIALLSARRATLEAMIARLRAERTGAADIAFPSDLLTRADAETEAARAVAAERHVFASRATALADQIAVLDSRILQIGEVVAGTRVQLVATERQRALIAEELAATRQLYDRGYAPKTKLLALERGIAQLDGRIGEERATIARSLAAIGEAQQTMIQLRSGRSAEVARELQSAETQLAELVAKLTSAQRTLDISDVRAPTDGTVFDLRTHTIGGVVTPGESILDIVPRDAPLVVEARVAPTDIEDIRPGMPAEVRLSGFAEIDRPILAGTVAAVSADSLADDRTGEKYFLATIRADRTGLSRAGYPMLVPGMRADVVVTTGARTAVDFLFGPILDSLYFSTRER